MNINKDLINEALLFYNIKDTNYKNCCYNTFDSLNTKDINRIKNLCDLFYIKKEDINNYRNKTEEELFGISIPFITNILLLIGYIYHKENMKKLKFTKKDIEIHKKRIKETLTNDIYFRNYDKIRISQLLWGIRLINCKIIEVGRLQYEITDTNPITNLHDNNIIKIHIPRGNKLDYNLVLESLKKSKYYIKKYLNIETPKYYCNSWLLSKEVKSIVNKDSNIAKFYNLFTIKKEEDGKKDILNFVFGLKECNNYNLLPENTSLQKKLKEKLLLNKPINIGYGILNNLGE